MPNNTLTAIKNYQLKFGSAVDLNMKIESEVFYNEFKVFNRLSYYYAIVGLIMILLLIQQILKERKWRNYIMGLLF